jgi:hypothetical protein
MLDALGDMVYLLCSVDSDCLLMTGLSTRKSRPKCCRTLTLGRRMPMVSPFIRLITISPPWICASSSLSHVPQRNSRRWNATHTKHTVRLISISKSRWKTSSESSARARMNDGTMLSSESYLTEIGCYFGTAPAAPILLVG